MNEAINIIGQGVTDPHIHVFGDRAYLYASHDYSSDSTTFDMRDWQIWSSDDLLNWTLECTLKPEETYIGAPTDGCWATDAVEKNGRHYWIFSDVHSSPDGARIGMVESDSPTGPWKDMIGGPLLPPDSADTNVYDPCLFKEEDGSVYILFGIWNYHIARMSEDMRSITEEPRPIEVTDPHGPYGAGKTDDKVSLHKHNGLYYLSWGSYYATSETLHGPYAYRGCIVEPERVEPRFRDNTWPHGPTQGRHGNFFEWKDQWHFTYCEMAFSGNRYFRDFWISRIEYADDGRILPIQISSNCIAG